MPRAAMKARDGARRGMRVLMGALWAVLIAGSGLQACANSILRNAAEAGLETALDVPLPTPTTVPPQRTP